MASDRSAAEPTPPRLAAYAARTQAGLDLFALLTIWLALLPLAGIGFRSGDDWILVCRLGLSFVFGVDLAIRAVLSGRPVRYVLGHPVLLAAVIVPPVRIVFSLRLLQGMFRRGNLVQFLVVAGLLLLNGSIIVLAFEHGAPGADIETIGEALWWAVVTVATVGYGDFAPVTVGGRVTATALMALGVVILATVTAQVASAFNEQANKQRSVADDDIATAARRRDDVELATVTAQHAELLERFARLERLVAATGAASPAETAVDVGNPGAVRAQAPPPSPPVPGGEAT